jgi:NADH dehydrogenase [ubiquinone] 1 alpha subcomplex assembly factor 2
LKVLAAEADARWAAKPSFLDSPEQERGQPLPALEVKDPGGHATSTEAENRASVRSTVGGGPKDAAQRIGIAAPETEGKEEHNGKMQVPDGIRHHFVQRPVQGKSTNPEEKKAKEDPWKQARGGPSEEWQPAACRYWQRTPSPILDSFTIFPRDHMSIIPKQSSLNNC